MPLVYHGRPIGQARQGQVNAYLQLQDALHRVHVEVVRLLESRQGPEAP